MRKVLFFDNVDVSTDPTSSVFEIPCGQDMRFLIQFVLSGVSDTIKVYIEESIDGVVWTSMANPSNCSFAFDLEPSNSPIGIKDNYFMGLFMRLRIESNGATGLLTAKMGYKSRI